MATVAFQSFADNSRASIVERHVQCAQSAMHLTDLPLSLAAIRYSLR